MNCIIIDDEEIAREILTQMIFLSNSLFSESVFSDALQAMRFLNTSTVDLIFFRHSHAQF